MNERPVITAEYFEHATGYAPMNDDLDRCNCPQAGEMRHWGCGWDWEADLPMFLTMRRFTKP
jgi:hypothetical protein